MVMYYGVVRGNRIELDNGARLAEGLRVEIRPRAHEELSDNEPRRTENLRVMEDAFKDSLRATGRLAPAAVGGATLSPDRHRIEVSGEPLSEQIMRERR
ncbi:MAG: hypothetical protein LC769_01475 [Chloroflexi bacterium]|nr:hypothetical protein [Chloroflexota bacterium]